jgi:hypothetical protein
VQDFSELAESAHIRSEFGEVHHFVLGRGGGHFGVFGVEHWSDRQEPGSLIRWFGDARGLGEKAGWEVAGEGHDYVLQWMRA